jgi:hypothetical protein
MTTPDDHPQPERCCAHDVAHALRLVALEVVSVQLLAEWPVCGYGEAWVATDDWQVAMDVRGGMLERVARAAGPGGVTWSHGCERDDWRRGPDSVLVEPLALLTAEERDALQRVVYRADVSPPAEGVWSPIFIGPPACVERSPPTKRRRKTKAKTEPSTTA